MAPSTDVSLAVTAAPIGVDAALRAASDPSFVPKPTLLQKEFSLDGRVAVVTGGGRGLGLEMAEALAEAGATVYCLAKSAAPTDTWKATQAYVSKLGLSKSARLEYVSADVSNQKAVWSAFEDIAQKEGRLNICVACAGIAENGPALDMTAEQFEKVMDVNANGAFYTVQAAGRQMKRLSQPGSIVLITSIAGSVALRDLQTVNLNSSKGAGIQMARSMACELAPHGIRVNSLSPGYIPTEFNQGYIDADPEIGRMWSSQNPLGRLGKPFELRGAIAWLASDASSFCTGSDIRVDGGHCAW